MGMNDRIASAIEQVKISQERIEMRAVDTINQQDKVYHLLKENQERAMELMTNFEAVCFELEMVTATIDEKYGDIMEEEDISKFSGLFELMVNQGGMIQELSRVFQALMDEEEVTKEVVLSMEEEIAVHRDSLDLTEEILVKTIEEQSMYY